MKNAAGNYVVHMRWWVSRVNSREEKIIEELFSTGRRESVFISIVIRDVLSVSISIESTKGFKEIMKAEYLR